MRQQRPLLEQLLQQPHLPRLLVPLQVRAQPEVARDRVQRLAVPDRLVAAVQRQQGEAEALELADQVAQLAIRDRRQPDIAQRLVRHHQRLDQLLAVHERLEASLWNRRRAELASLQQLDALVQPALQVIEQHAVGLLVERRAVDGAAAVVLDRVPLADQPPPRRLPGGLLGQDGEQLWRGLVSADADLLHERYQRLLHERRPP